MARRRVGTRAFHALSHAESPERMAWPGLTRTARKACDWRQAHGMVHGMAHLSVVATWGAEGLA
eukprot:180639-Chlamydomonas_euryale.AAC.2